MLFVQNKAVCALVLGVCQKVQSGSSRVDDGVIQRDFGDFMPVYFKDIKFYLRRFANRSSDTQRLAEAGPQPQIVRVGFCAERVQKLAKKAAG